MYICKYASVFYGDEGYNDWKITEKINNPGNKKLDANSLNMEVLSRMEERTRRRVLENRYGAIMIVKNKIHGCYIVKSDRPPHKFQEYKDIFQAQVPWLASTATFRPQLNAGSMELGSTTCRGQRHGVGTGGERGTEQGGEQTAVAGETGNRQGMAKGESDGDEEANGEGKRKGNR